MNDNSYLNSYILNCALQLIEFESLNLSVELENFYTISVVLSFTSLRTYNDDTKIKIN